MPPCRWIDEYSFLELLGTGGPEKIQFLKDLLRSTRADVAFISETRLRVNSVVRQLQRIHGYK
jgi:hypothetical protein